jgi:cardiolipin synthase
MVIAWTPGQDKLVPLLLDAVGRNVEVTIIGDSYTRFWLMFWGNPIWKRRGESQWQKTVNYNKELIKAGAHVVYVGKIKANPFAGRCHSKITIIDDAVFSFGGVNLGDVDLSSASEANNDYMLTATDTGLADQLYTIVQAIDKNQLVLPNVSTVLDERTTLLFDGGTPKDSVIYDTACHLAARAKKIYYVSQFPPSGRLGYLVSQKPNECYFNPAGKLDFPLSIPFSIDAMRYKLTNNYRKDQYLHAKFMLIEDEDGSKHLISGSNNFSWSGISFGTKEIAIYSTNEELWQDLFTYLEERVR